MKRPLIVSALCILATILLLVWGFGRPAGTKAAPAKTYALIVEGDTGTFVMQLRKGLTQAASESGAQLTVLIGDAFTPKKDWAAVVLWLENPDAAIRTLEAAGVPCALVGQTAADIPWVVSDEESAGRQMIEYALTLEPGENVALVLDETDARASARGRAAVQWGKTGRVRVLTYEPGMALPADCPVAVAVSLRATEDFAARKRAGAWEGQLVGVDTGEKRVDDLETGIVAAMALENPFAMGYQAFDLARRVSLGERDVSARTQVLLATPDNMYLSQNVKQVFPLLQ